MSDIKDENVIEEEITAEDEDGSYAEVGYNAESDTVEVPSTAVSTQGVYFSSSLPTSQHETSVRTLILSTSGS